MPVSLGRRIRRIGLLLSTKNDKEERVHNYDPDLTETDKAEIIKNLRLKAVSCRLSLRKKEQEEKDKRKARVKAGRKGPKPSDTKKKK